MKKVFTSVACAIALFATTTSCSDDSWDGLVSQVTISTTFASTNVSAADISGVKVKFVDINTQDIASGEFDASGRCDVNLSPGVYNIEVESEAVGTGVDAVKYCSMTENVTVNEETQNLSIEIKAFPAVANNDGFIISEYFFNGETNSGFMMHPDQYIVVHNSSLVTKYADGLSFATTDQSSIRQPEPYLASTISEKVAVVGFFTIPGDGKQYPVKPGEEIVIAMTAFDHSSVKTTIVDKDGVEHAVSYDNAVNLEGVDFEWYNQDPDAKDTDNPAVPNVIATNGTWEGYGAYMHPRAFYSALLFKLKDGQPATIAEFHAANTEIYKYPNSTDEDGNTIEGEEVNLTSIPNSMVLDAICTGDRALVTRPFAESLDRGHFQVSGCHRQELAIRKKITVDGVTYFQDTNNTSEDFEMRKGQTSFPIGWRN